jgi:hypothetical protein
MTTYTPPAEAVEAACRAVHPTRWEYRTIAHPCEECATAVTAAGPIIAAEALREAAETLRAEDRTHDGYADWLKRRGARLSRGEGA